MTPPAVSVVVPTHNRANLIGRALDSALRETGPLDEIIVVDDGSVDDTPAVLERYRDRVRCLRVLNGGAGRARNLGIREARKPLVAFLDSDDEWMPGGLALRRAVMAARPDVLFCFSDFAVRDRENVEHRRYLPNWHHDERPWEQILGSSFPFSSVAEIPGDRDFRVYAGNLYLAELKANYVFTSTLVARREAAGEALRFAEDLPTYEDWVCFGRLARAGTAAYLDCETAWQHGHAGPRLTGTDALRTASARLGVLAAVWGNDRQFLERHGTEYESVLAGCRTARAKALIGEGRTAEARRELRAAGSAPWTYRLAASLPGPSAALLIRLTRGFRNLLSPAS
jgi:hypothetical protein